MNRMNREDMARRVARDIAEGAYVNMGIGLPTRVADYLPADKEIFLQSANGLLGMGPAPGPGDEDPELMTAGNAPGTILPGGCFFEPADTLAMLCCCLIHPCVSRAFLVGV